MRKWKWFKRGLVGLAMTALTGWLSSSWLLRHWTAKPPPLPANTAIRQLKTESRDGKTWLGQSWTGRREGLQVVYLKGTPFEIGYAAGVLLQDQMHTLENEFITLVRGYVPEDWKLRLLNNYLVYRNRELSRYVPLDYRVEIYGSTLGCSDIHPEFGPFYHRLLNYHAAHDVSYMMIDNPLVSRAGCTSFGAWGAATESGHLLSGRNFDWEAAEVFSRDRFVVMCEPDQGIPFISLSWAAMAGVVSGMNRAGVSVTINGAPSKLPSDIGTPVAMVARDIMQHAHNLTEAIDILRKAKAFVSTLWLIGSRTDGRFVVVEKTPLATQVREPEGDWIICANHFQTPGLEEDPRNRAYTNEATSVVRQLRLRELIEERASPITAPEAAAFLRDRNLAGGAFAGNGHRAAINALIATHSTIMDLTSGIFWAASPPHQLGKYVAFDVQDFSRELPQLTVPADALLASGDFDRARQARELLVKAQRALKARDAESCLKLADQAESLNPGFYQNATLRGRALLATGKSTEAAKAFESALAAQPAFLKEKQEIEGWLQKAREQAK